MRQSRHGRALIDALQAQSALHTNVDTFATTNDNNSYYSDNDNVEFNMTDTKSTNQVVPAVPTRVNLINRVIRHCSTNANVNNNNFSISDDNIN